MRTAASSHTTDQTTLPPRVSKRKLLLIIVGAILLATILALLLVPRKHYSELISSRIAAAAHHAGINLVITEPEAALVGLSAKSISLFIPKIFTTIDLRSAAFRMSLPSLLLGSVNGTMEATFLGGTLKAELRRSIGGGEANIEAMAQELKLQELIQLRAFSVESGTLSAQLEQGKVDASGIPLAGTWKITVTNLTKTQDTFFQLPAKAGGGFVAIPTVKDLNVTASGTLSQEQVVLTSLTSESSLGSCSLSGTIGLPPRSTLNVNGRLSLTEESQRKFGPFLPMISNNKLPSTATAANIAISGTLQRPVVTLSPP